MIRRPTIILLVIFAALLALAFYLRENPQPSEASLTPSPTPYVEVLDGIDSGEIIGFTLKEAQGNEIVVTRNAEGAWQLENSDQEPLEPGKIEQIRAQIAAMRVMTFLPEDNTLDPGALGLNAPSYTITVRSNSDRQDVITVGNKTPTGNGYYAQVNGQAPIVIDINNIDMLVDLINELLLPEPTEESVTPAP